MTMSNWIYGQKLRAREAVDRKERQKAPDY